MGSGSSTTGVKKISTTHDQKSSPHRNLSLYQFHRVIKSTIVEIHSQYLNPTGTISCVLSDLTQPESQEFELLIYGCSNSDAASITSQLQYVIENIIYEVSGIMPTQGLLGTSYKSSGIYELIREGNTFPDGYFLQCEIDRLQFDEKSRVVYIGDGEAFMLLIGMYITRGLITTASEWKVLKTKDDDPPRLITVINPRNEIQNIYIVGGGQEIDTNVGLIRDGLLCLMYSYYAWDLSYPGITNFWASYSIIF